MMADKLQAPFQYFGGKSRIAHIVWRAFGKPHNYIEPFCGSAAVLLARPINAWPSNKIAVETINDMDGYITNFWRVITDADLTDRLAEMMNYPVSEIDLEARHRWLVHQPDKDEFLARMKTDPEHHDLQRAAWWCWGLCQWIGAGWCAGEWFGPGCDENHGRGVCNGAAKMPQLGAGMGIHKQLHHLGDAGQGECQRRYSVLKAWMQSLADRMRAVRVCCGDWMRVCKSPTTTTFHGMTAVFLDPPYAGEAGRDNNIYRCENLTVADDVRSWCADRGDDPMMRIALCGYEGEHEDLESAGWRAVAWKTQGGYGNQGQGKANAHRERIWFSPHCVNEKTLLTEAKHD